MDFGVKLKAFRKDRGETLHMVAMGTNIDSTLLSKFERGVRLPTDEQVQRLAGYFGIDKGQMAAETTAGRILFEYGSSDVTYKAVMYVQEIIEKNYIENASGGKND